MNKKNDSIILASAKHGCDVKSYSKFRAVSANLFAVCFAVFILLSCTDNTGKSMFQSSGDATNAYARFLSDMKKKDNLSTDTLIEHINEWQSLRDSVLACVGRDTVQRVYEYHEGVIRTIHDSLRIEFIRLATSQTRTFRDVLLIKEKTSPYKEDSELLIAAQNSNSFFLSLDSLQIPQSSGKSTLANYKTFLSTTLKDGINSKEDLLRFIRQEDLYFRQFLQYLPQFAVNDVSAITQDTEKCCMAVFQSAEQGKLNHKDALIYIARRTNRRLLLNAETCMRDISQGKITTAEQARAYVWMLLQSYITLDGFSSILLSKEERESMLGIAEHTPEMIERLNKIIGADYEQWKELPTLLVKIMITTI